MADMTAPTTARRWVAAALLAVLRFKGDLLIVAGAGLLCMVLATFDWRLPVTVVGVTCVAIGSRL